MKIVEANGLSDTITLIKGKIEEISLPDGIDKVDIIISEWMGYFLLYESMLDTVLFARDKWLAPGGMIFPDKATIYICAIEDEEYRTNKIEFWDNVYGFDMSCIKELALMEPLVDVCDPKQICSNNGIVLDVDIYTVTKEQLDFASKFELQVTRDDYIHAIVAYFTVEFSKTHTKLKFSTGPRSEYTHWKQTVFYLDEPVVAKAGDVLSGDMKVARNPKNPRDVDILINTNLKPKNGGDEQKQTRNYRLR